MSKFSQKIQSSLALVLAILFFLIFFSPIPLKALECEVSFKASNATSIVNEEIEKKVSSYLTSNSCFLVPINFDIKYEITDLFEESGVVYTTGSLLQGENRLSALFSIEKGWLSSTTNLLYMTTDTPQSPFLFKDIYSSAQAALPDSLSSYHVLIQKIEDPTLSTGCNLQNWTFYKPGKKIEVIVLTNPNLNNGTDFSVTIPEQ